MLSFLFSFFSLSFLFFLNLNWFFYLLILFSFFPFVFFLNFSFYSMSKNMMICFDMFSFQMIVLTLLITVLCYMSSFKFMKFSFNYFFSINFMFLCGFLFLFFFISNFFFFFFFFECTLLPTLYIVLGWGNKIERVQSGLYLFFYTLFGSMPMLVGIFYVYSLNCSLSFYYFDSDSFFFLLNFVLVFSFLIKMPMFLVHSWLPKAHVEAPVSGSMVLAGVLLKMGGYGIFRLLYFFKFNSLNNLWIYISIIGGLASSMVCVRQVDLKSLVAYSSVSHMSMVIASFFTFFELGEVSCFMMMVAHGLCSSGLFYLINVVYERSGTRSVFLNKGLISVFPSLSLVWFILCCFNMGCPPSLNLLSEIFLIFSCFSWNFFFIFFLMFMSFLGAVYNLFMFSFCNHGYCNSSLIYLSSCYFVEYLVLFLHLTPITLFFLKLDFFYFFVF